MNSSGLFIVYLVVNSLLVVYLLRLSEGVLKPLLTYLYHLSMLLYGLIVYCVLANK